ncbi:hypothetical protein G6514_001927, partial [Epicoccum nigrum]
PFLNRYPLNSSWEIASALPALLPASPQHPTPIQITVHHEPIRVSYRHVARALPSLLDRNPADIILHMGLAASRSFFALEQGAHTRGYGATADVDGRVYPDADAETLFPATEVPRVLQTGFDVEDVLGRWKAEIACLAGGGEGEGEGRTALAGVDVRTNPDAGNFLCGFLYANALARSYRTTSSNGEEAEEKADAPVAFLHVPDLSNRRDGRGGVELGRAVVIALLRALVESWRLKGVGGHQNQGKGQGGAEQHDDRRNNE